MTVRSWIVLLATLSLAALAGCGVRGVPQPPLTPAELGRGQPTFKRSSDTDTFPTPTPSESAPELKK